MGGTSTVAPIDPKEDEVKSGLGKLVTYGSVVDIAMMFFHPNEPNVWNSTYLLNLKGERASATIGQYMDFLARLEDIDISNPDKELLKSFPKHLIDSKSLKAWRAAVTGLESATPGTVSHHWDTIINLMGKLEPFLRSIPCLDDLFKPIPKKNISTALKKSKAIRCRILSARYLVDEVKVNKLCDELTKAAAGHTSACLGLQGCGTLRGYLENLKNFSKVYAVDGFLQKFQEQLEGEKAKMDAVKAEILTRAIKLVGEIRTDIGKKSVDWEDEFNLDETTLPRLARVDDLPSDKSNSEGSAADSDSSATSDSGLAKQITTVPPRGPGEKEVRFGGGNTENIVDLSEGGKPNEEEEVTGEEEFTEEKKASDAEVVKKPQELGRSARRNRQRRLRREEKAAAGKNDEED